MHDTGHQFLLQEVGLVSTEEELRTAHFAASLAVGISLEALPRDNETDIQAAAAVYMSYTEMLKDIRKQQLDKYSMSAELRTRALELSLIPAESAKRTASDVMRNGGYVVRIVADESSGPSGASLDTFKALAAHIAASDSSL